jgi:hypothetical protein
MIRLLSRLLFVVALSGSGVATGADLQVRPTRPVEPRQGRSFGVEPAYVPAGNVLLWRAYGWPGGQAGPCWRLWYGQWIWSC